MSLASRLGSVQVTPTNHGCRTCRYLLTLSHEDRTAFDDWMAAGHSATQLWEICLTEGLEISYTGFLHHRRHHKSLHESG